MTFGGAPRDTYLDIKPKNTGPGREKKAGEEEKVETDAVIQV